MRLEDLADLTVAVEQYQQDAAKTQRVTADAQRKARGR